MLQKLSDKPTPMTLLLKGAPGSGKTTKAAHFPNPVFFNFDNNLSGLKKLPKEIRDNVMVMDPSTDKDGKTIVGHLIWKNFVTQLTEIADSPIKYTIVIDSLTTLASKLIDFILGSSEPSAKMQIQHWGDFSRYLKWLGEKFLCANDLDKHVIIIAHEQIEKDELTQSIIYTLNIGGSLRSSFDLYFTDCWRCFVKSPTGGAVEYMVRVVPTSQSNAKCSLVGIPNEFNWDKDKDKILSQIK